MIAFILFSAFALLMIYGAVRDVASFTIPNWVSIALAVLFVPAAFASGLPLADIGFHAATGFAVLLIGMAMFALRWVGGGDAKLLAAAALWMGWPDILPFLALAAILGGAFTLFLLIARRSLGPAADARGLSLPILQRTGDIPYGVAIAGAALIWLPRTGLGAALLGAGV